MSSRPSAHHPSAFSPEEAALGQENRTAAPAGHPRLPHTQINPVTGLATDYLNHFNEAILLLEMLFETPDRREDFIAWEPKNYRQHFAASNFEHRDVAIACYEAANPALRQRLDALADMMNEILVATREVMRQDLSIPVATSIADLALRWVKPLVGRAGAVINGLSAEPSAAGQAPGAMAPHPPLDR